LRSLSCEAHHRVATSKTSVLVAPDEGLFVRRSLFDASDPGHDNCHDNFGAISSRELGAPVKSEREILLHQIETNQSTIIDRRT
jgi:hypothetical protein